MYKTIEEQVLKKTAPAELRAEFIQHEFERMQSFSLLIYIVSIGMWLLFDLIVSFLGGQGFTWRSMIFLALFAVLTVVLAFTRKAHHFNVITVLFVLGLTVGIRFIVNGLPPAVHSSWLVLAAASMLYSISVLPLSRWSFFVVQVLIWVLLNPFINTTISLIELRGVLTACYSVFLCALTIYTFLKLREAKLYNYIMSRLLLDQAYNDPLTEIPNRRSFMTVAEQHLQAVPREHDHYLAMIDIDNFKKVNDTYGHDVGDEVLKRIAADIKTVMLPFDYARLGGEEFAIYLAGVRREDVEALATELCRLVREQPTRHPVTISIGLTCVEDNDTLTQALIKADAALYESKHTGKDRYTFHQ
ncbi:GGDEF domain-containing protein [Pseudomonas sp. MYb2]|uniref:GGDEF domain-containing protein n=1 Tax=unclassified Pseudomonas TaxID=196821 RepID=UPI000CFFC05F|nr:MULTISPECIES: GGDEF domain-containing protein [unclassified Pseudomonas]PRB44632.1 GGDEF domain-containing protein [Pseudomonas sp. MYb3]PRC30211.1 GGDEF domain-containing protein [Pseudomonas sp. MYb2]